MYQLPRYCTRGMPFTPAQVAAAAGATTDPGASCIVCFVRVQRHCGGDTISICTHHTRAARPAITTHATKWEDSRHSRHSRLNNKGCNRGAASKTANSSVATQTCTQHAVRKTARQCSSNDSLTCMLLQLLRQSSGSSRSAREPR